MLKYNQRELSNKITHTKKLYIDIKFCLITQSSLFPIMCNIVFYETTCNIILYFSYSNTKKEEKNSQFARFSPETNNILKQHFKKNEELRLEFSKRIPTKKLKF